jgi:hypothetical protein
MYRIDIVLLDLDVQSRGQGSRYGHSFMFTEACLAGQSGDDEQIELDDAEMQRITNQDGLHDRVRPIHCGQDICTFSQDLCFSSLLSPISSLCFHYDLS